LERRGNASALALVCVDVSQKAAAVRSAPPKIEGPGEESTGGPVHNSARVIGLLGPLKYHACFTWGGDDGSDQEAHIRPEGGTDAEAPRGGTQSSGNPQA
jgi:hypothetical protein